MLKKYFLILKKKMYKKNVTIFFFVLKSSETYAKFFFIIGSLWEGWGACKSLSRTGPLMLPDTLNFSPIKQTDPKYHYSFNISICNKHFSWSTEWDHEWNNRAWNNICFDQNNTRFREFYVCIFEYLNSFISLIYL